MKLAGAYNCVLAGVYNYMSVNCRLIFPLEAIAIGPELFSLRLWDCWLTSEPPQHTVERFLRSVGCELAFKDLGDPDRAIAAARALLDLGEVVPAAINLKYSYFDPTPFDQDCWNFQLLWGYMGDGRYRMFDMYHAKAYEVKEEQLRGMIDTPFNYRHKGTFTPFMSIKAPDLERTRSLLSNYDGRSALLAAIDGYDAAASLKTGERWCGELRRTFEEVREEDFYAEVYKLMGHLMLIWRSRAYFMGCLRNRGLPDSEDMALDEEWNAFVHAVPRSLYRRSSEEYEALLERYRKLIALERELLAAIKERLLSFEPPEIRAAAGANPLGIGE